MRKFIVVMLALAMALVASTASAATGKAFMHDVKSPAQLAQMIEASLAKDLTGKSMLSPAKCDSDGSCGSSLNFLQALQKHPAGKHLTDVNQISGYLQTLEEREAPPGEYWISCLVSSVKSKIASKGTYHAVMHCLSRAFKPGLKVWVDPKTNLIVFDQFCTNVVEKPVKDECVYIPFTVTARETVSRFGLLGPAAVKEDDGCLGLQRVGEVEFERWWSDECPEVGCDFSADAQVVGQPVQIFGSIRLLAPGEYVLRLPAYVAEKSSKYVTVLCFERGNPGPSPYSHVEGFPTDELYLKDPAMWGKATGVALARLSPEKRKAIAQEYDVWRGKWLISKSDGMGVRWYDYRVVSSGRKEARMFPTLADVPPGMPELYIPWGEWGPQQAR